MSLTVIAAVAAAGAIAGGLGSLLGIGGGVFLVPLLHAGLGLDFKVAAATGLMTVIATSSAVSAGNRRPDPIHPPLTHLLSDAASPPGPRRRRSPTGAAPPPRPPPPPHLPSPH